MMQIDSTNNFQTLKRAHHVILTLYVSFKTFKKIIWLKRNSCLFIAFMNCQKNNILGEEIQD